MRSVGRPGRRQANRVSVSIEPWHNMPGGTRRPYSSRVNGNPSSASLNARGLETGHDYDAWATVRMASLSLILCLIFTVNSAGSVHLLIV